MLCPKPRRDPRRNRKGAVVVLAALCLSAFLGVIALAIDGGLWMAERRRAQTAADSAAMAAAAVMFERYDADKGLDPQGKARAAALEYAAMHGYTNDESMSPPQRQVIVEIPPTADEGPGNPEHEYEQQFVGKNGYVKVRIQTSQKRLFSAIFDGGDLAVTRRAVAGGANETSAYSPAAVIVLDPSSTGSLNISASGQLRAGGGLKVNSSHANAINASASSKVIAPDIELVGGANLSGSATVKETPHPPLKPIVDPLAALDPPTEASLPLVSSAPVNVSGSGKATLNPGVYNGGISGSGSATITLRPGVYYMKNGGFSLSGSASSLNASEVMIYLDGGGSLNLSGGGALQLTAPKSGPFAGIAVYQKRSSIRPVLISGGANSEVTGTVYAAGAKLNLSGSGELTQYGSQLIVYKLNISGGSNIWTSGDPETIARRSVSLLGIVE